MVFILPAVRRSVQVALFEAALEQIRMTPDLVNAALDVTLDPSGVAQVTRYDLP